MSGPRVSREPQFGGTRLPIDTKNTLRAPLKHKLYPERMTIAAGFCYKGGVLLCSDSELTIGNSKMEGMKIGKIEGKWGRAFAVCAGNVDYATAAFQECERRQEYKDFKDDPIAILAATLEDYYWGFRRSRTLNSG
jgi:hypothetical protein